jgi:hypothetical protein
MSVGRIFKVLPLHAWVLVRAVMNFRVPYVGGGGQRSLVSQEGLCSMSYSSHKDRDVSLTVPALRVADNTRLQ